MWDMNSINEEGRVYFKESRSIMALLLTFALTTAKGSFESGKLILKITCESGKLFTTGCRLPPKSTNFGTLHHWNHVNGFILIMIFRLYLWIEVEQILQSESELKM